MTQQLQPDGAAGAARLTIPIGKSETDRGLESLVKRAITDAAFRTKALGSPSAAFIEVTGKPLPPDFVLRLVDNAHAHLSMVLPDPIAGRAPAPPAKAAFSPTAEWTEQEAESAAEALVERAKVDPPFRALALRDAREAITELTGKSLPEGFTLRFFDNAGATRTIILPDLLAPRTELTDAELAAVAGGGQSKWGKIVSGVVNWGSKVVGGVVSVATAGTGSVAGVAIGLGGSAASSGCHYF